MIARRFIRALVFGTSVALLATSVVFADTVTNDVAANPGADTITAGGSTIVSYKINSTGGDGQTGCNASDSSPATVNIAAPAGVTVTPSSALSFNYCGNPDKAATFSSNTPGDYVITATVSDAGPGTYNVNPATWTLHVLPAPPSDSDAPVITLSINALDSVAGTGWYNIASSGADGVRLDVSAFDGSGVTNISCVDGSTLVYSEATDGNFSVGDGSHSISCTATDGLGNSGAGAGSTSMPLAFKVDQTTPTISAAVAPARPASGWWNAASGAPTVTYTCGDGGSGLASCSSPVTFGEGEDQTDTGTATDLAGNSNTATVTNIDVDLTTPTVTVTGFTDGAVFYVGGSLPTAGCTSSDGLSGINSTGGPTMTGGLNGNGVGSVTYTCTASDNAGNLGSDSRSYSVIYNPAGFSGILQPINPDNTSLFSRGKAVPVKFRLGGDEPNGFDYGGWTLQRIKVSCTNFDAEDAAIEAVVENPSNAFRYDAGADQYINNASFKDQAAGTCWKVRVTLDSLQTMDSAVFRLQK